MKEEDYSAGQKLYLRQTGERVVVSRVMNSEWVYVLLDGDEIPVPREELVISPPEILQKKAAGLKKQSSVKQNNTKNVPSGEKLQEHHVHPGSGQILIAFEPYTENGETTSFQIHLINDTHEAVTFEYDFFLNGESPFSLKKIITSHDVLLLHEIDYDDLNELPEFLLKGRDIYNRHFRFHHAQKIKPQNFFNKKKSVPVFNREAFAYLIPVEKITSAQRGDITSENVHVDADLLKHYMTETVLNKDHEVGSPVEEIDLHIEVLTSMHASMPSAEKLYFQLQQFQQALERAMAHHAEKFFVIHGVGSGKLKREIHRMLKNYPGVRSFNNDYHPRFGYGATEVFFK